MAAHHDISQLAEPAGVGERVWMAPQGTHLSDCAGLYEGRSVDVAGNARIASLAKTSLMAQANYAKLLSYLAQVTDPELASLVRHILENPAPTFMVLYKDKAAQERVCRELIEAKYLKAEDSAILFPPLEDPAMAPQAFWAAPGSRDNGHHSYPGGLAAHVAMFVKTTMAYAENFRESFAADLDSNLIISTALLHDMAKPWVLQWGADGVVLPEAKVAGTGVHHILALAELLFRGVRPELVVSVACVHGDVGRDEKKIVDYILAAALLAGVDPVAAAYLVKTEQGFSLAGIKKLEYFAVSYGDNDWTLSVAISKPIITLLEKLYAERTGHLDESFPWFRNRLLAKYTTEKLYWVYSNAGEGAVMELLRQD